MAVMDTHSGMFFITTPSFVDDLEPTSFDVSFDVDRTPYAIAHLTVPRPPSATLRRWDPRTYPRFDYRLLQQFEATSEIPATLAVVSDLYAGATVADTTTAAAAGTLADFSAPFAPAELVTQWNADPQPIFSQVSGSLYVTDVDPTNYTDDTVTLTLQSGEFRLDGHKNVATAANNLGSRTIYSLLANMVARVGGQVSRWAGDTETVSGELTLWLPGDSISEFIEPILEARGLRLYSDEYGEFRLAPIGEHSGIGVTGSRNLLYTAGMVAAERVLSVTGGDEKAGWFDACQVIYDWTDSAGVDHTSYDIYPTNGANTRAVTIRRESPYPGPGAAAGIVRRSLRRGYTLSLTHVSDYSFGPGWTAGVQLPDDLAPTNWECVSVQFDYPQGEMSVRLQTPFTS